MVSEIIESLESQKTIDAFIDKQLTDIPITVDKDLFAGDLKDRLCELVSSYAYFSNMLSVANYLIAMFAEHDEDQSLSHAKKLKTPYKGKMTEREKRAIIKDIKVAIDLDGMQITTTIQGLSFFYIKTCYLRDRLKVITETIEKSIAIGMTILSYNKVELRNLNA